MGSFPLASRSQSQRDCSLSAKSRTQLNLVGRRRSSFDTVIISAGGKSVVKSRLLKVARSLARSLTYHGNPLIEENEILTDPPPLNPFLSPPFPSLLLRDAA